MPGINRKKAVKIFTMTSLFFVAQLFFPLIYKRLQAQVYMSISGNVFDKNTSQPVIETYVAIHQINAGSVTDEFDLAKTDSDGKYIFDQVPPGEYWMYALAPKNSGYGEDMRLTSETIKVEQTNVIQDFALEKSSSISGIVLGQDKTTPMKNVVVVSASSSSVKSTQTNEDGLFSFSGLAPGGPYIILAFPLGHATTVADIDLLSAGQHKTNVDFHLNPQTGSTFSGKVVSQDGVAIPNTIVTFFSPETTNVGSVETDDAGDYRLEGIVPGNYVGIAASEQFSSTEVENIDITTDQEKVVNFTLQPLPAESGLFWKRANTTLFAMFSKDYNSLSFMTETDGLFANEVYAQLIPPSDNKACTNTDSEFRCCVKYETKRCVSVCEEKVFGSYCEYWSTVCKLDEVLKILEPKFRGFGWYCKWQEKGCKRKLRAVLEGGCHLWAHGDNWDLGYCYLKLHDMPLPSLFCDDFIK